MATTSTPSHTGHDHDSPEYIKASVRKYLMIGGVLYVLTVLTVVISYFELPTMPTLILGMAVAGTKASLVALFFMHLIDEKKLIYYTLGLTVFMFGVCMLIPSLTTHSAVGEHQRVDVKAQGEVHHDEPGHDAPKDGSGAHH